MTRNNSALPAEKKPAPVAVYDYGSYADIGADETTSADLAIPFLQILQSNSPQVEDEKPGCKPGLLFNSVTGEVYDAEKGVVFQPAYKEHVYVEWIPRDSGGGFVGVHQVDSPVVAKAIEALEGQRVGKIPLEGGNELIETFYVYGLILDNEGQETLGFAVVPFTSTKIKPYKKWWTSIHSIKGKPPYIASRARFTAEKQKNDKGTFYNFSITPLKGSWRESLIDPVNEQHLLQEAVGFREMVLSGVAKAAYETQQAGDESEGKAPF